MSDSDMPIMETNFSNTTPLPEECQPLTDGEVEIFHAVSWWFEGLLQFCVGSIGFLANAVAIPILCSKEMNRFIFNRLLIVLAVFDNFFIVCSVLEGIRKNRNEFSQVHEYAFGSFLYQFHQIVLCISIYLTVSLALERYRAVWRPIEYHNRCKAYSPMRCVANYVVPVCVLSVVFNIPKFFEVEFIVNPLNDTESGSVINQTLASPTDLRLAKYYVLFYVNGARLLVQGIIPFILLSFFNYRIYWVIRRRREMVNRPAAPTANQSAAESDVLKQKKANETQQAVVLFIIVLLFFLCHTPRWVVYLDEFFNLDSLRLSVASEGQGDCNDVSIWALVTASVAAFLLTVNASVNFFIYAYMCASFRSILLRLCNQALGWIVCACFRQDEIGRRNGNITSNGAENGALIKKTLKVKGGEAELATEATICNLSTVTTAVVEDEKVKSSSSVKENGDHRPSSKEEIVLETDL